MTAAHPSRPAVWIMASRPKTLFAAIAPVIIGCALAFADRCLHTWSALTALLGAVAIQIGTNFVNDYYDFKKGSDTPDRLGPTRVTQAGLVTPAAMKTAIAIAFGLAILIGVYLVYRGGWPIVIIGLSSVLFGILYTAGPMPLGYTGLADLFVLVFFGPVAVGGTYYVQTLTINMDVIIAGIAPGLFSVAILTVNNLRDIETDRRTGKQTLAARFGRNFARTEYTASVVVACLIPAWLLIRGGYEYQLALAGLTLPAAMPVITVVWRSTDGPTLNNTLANTGRLLLLYAVLFSVGRVL